MNKKNCRLRLNGKLMYSVEDVRKNFNETELVQSYKDGTLLKWLELFFYEDLAAKVRAVDINKNLNTQLKDIFFREEVEPPATIIPKKILQADVSTFKIETDKIVAEASKYHEEKNFRKAVGKYLDAYCLGRDEVFGKIIESLNALFPKESPGEENFFQSQKFLKGVIAVLAVAMIILLFANFDLSNNNRELNLEIDGYKSLNERLFNEIQDRQRKFDELKEELKDAERDPETWALKRRLKQELNSQDNKPK